MSTPSLLNTLKENIHRVLENYVGVETAHYRFDSSVETDFYDDKDSSEEPDFLGNHLIHVSTVDFDRLKNTIIHVEEILPIDVLLDPEVDWKEGDEVLIQINTVESLYSRSFEIAKVRSESHDNVVLYYKANLAPVRRP